MIALRPLIVPVGEGIPLVLDGLRPGGSYRAVILPARERDARLEHRGVADGEGRLRWQQAITWQGAASCELYAGEGDAPLASLPLYGAPAELARRRPLRCDFHIHTTLSDGASGPAEMVLRGRELGLDALAITDHNCYEGSVHAIEAAGRASLGLLCLTGEEVSAPSWHLLAIGARAAIGYTPDRAGYAGLLKTIAMVREQGGRAFLAHPYWSIEHGWHHLPSDDYRRLVAERGCDGIELLGDVEWEDNLRSVAQYQALADGERPPILGNSDTHRADHTYGGCWTLAFAETADREGVFAAIAERRTAVCALLTLGPPGQPVRPRLAAFGPFELVDLAIFLQRHYFPRHDELCREEAELGRRRLAGERLPEGSLEAVADRLEEHYRACWRTS